MVIEKKRKVLHLNSSLCEDLVLLQDALAVRLVGDFEECDAFDWGHGVLYSKSTQYTVCDVEVCKSIALDIQ